MTYITERKQHCGQCLDPDKLEVGWRISDAESSSEESEIEGDTHSENDSGGSSETETSMPGPDLQESLGSKTVRTWHGSFSL